MLSSGVAHIQVLTWSTHLLMLCLQRAALMWWPQCDGPICSCMHRTDHAAISVSTMSIFIKLCILTLVPMYDSLSGITYRKVVQCCCDPSYKQSD